MYWADEFLAAASGISVSHNTSTLPLQYYKLQLTINYILCYASGVGVPLRHTKWAQWTYSLVWFSPFLRILSVSVFIFFFVFHLLIVCHVSDTRPGSFSFVTLPCRPTDSSSFVKKIYTEIYRVVALDGCRMESSATLNWQTTEFPLVPSRYPSLLSHSSNCGPVMFNGATTSTSSPSNYPLELFFGKETSCSHSKNVKICLGFISNWELYSLTTLMVEFLGFCSTIWFR